MRNTLEYPITKEEVHSTLMDYALDIEEEQKQDLICGDLRGLIIQKLLDKIDGIYDIIDKN